MPGKTGPAAMMYDLLRRSFNGAPAGCRGRQQVCVVYPAVIDQLQWGPGRMPGKTRCLRQARSFRIRASMGPRQDAGEDMLLNG